MFAIHFRLALIIHSHFISEEHEKSFYIDNVSKGWEGRTEPEDQAPQMVLGLIMELVGPDLGLEKKKTFKLVSAMPR